MVLLLYYYSSAVVTCRNLPDSFRFLIWCTSSRLPLKCSAASPPAQSSLFSRLFVALRASVQLIISSDNLKFIGYLLPLILVEEGPDNGFDSLQQKHFSVCSLIFSVLRAQTKPTYPLGYSKLSKSLLLPRTWIVQLTFPVHNPELCVFIKAQAVFMLVKKFHFKICA